MSFLYRSAFLLALFVAAVPRAAALEFFVDPQSAAQAEPTGSIDFPFTTPEQARDAIRAMKQRGALARGGVTVWLRAGIYRRTESFLLTADDSGTEESPIVYRAYGNEFVRWVGGLPLDPASFRRVKLDDAVWPRLDVLARSSMYVMDLTAVTRDFGSLASRANGTGNRALELFMDGEPMELARYPDRVRFDEIAPDVPPAQEIPGWMRAGAVSDGLTTFTFIGDRPKRWTAAEDAWLMGYWGSYWDGRNARLEKIDTARRLLTKSRTNYPVKQGQPYFAYNLLEELTVPGEYYLDRDAGLLYFYPPAGHESGELFISMLQQPMILMGGACFISFQDITFEFARGDLVRIEGADDVIANCTLRNAGGNGAVIEGTRCGIERCEIANMGGGGVVLRGGDRAKLIPAGNFVRNTEIHDFGRLFWTYQPGVSINGCGNAVSHCEIHDAPHAGILLNGNEHRVEFTKFARLCQWVSDMGAFYAGRDWGFRGNLVRCNLFLPMRSPFGPDQHGVYLDDCVSGLTIAGNLFIGTSEKKSALMLGGGRDNTIENNIFAHNGFGIHFDNRGLKRIQPDGGSWDLLKKIADMDYAREPWLSAYPALAAIPAEWSALAGTHWLAPEGNIIRRNIFWDGAAYEDRTNPRTPFENANLVVDNLENTDPRFADEARGNWSLKPESPAIALDGYQLIPAQQIGIEP